MSYALVGKRVHIVCPRSKHIGHCGIVVSKYATTGLLGVTLDNGRTYAFAEKSLEVVASVSNPFKEGDVVQVISHCSTHNAIGTVVNTIGTHVQVQLDGVRYSYNYLSLKKVTTNTPQPVVKDQSTLMLLASDVDDVNTSTLAGMYTGSPSEVRLCAFGEMCDRRGEYFWITEHSMCDGAESHRLKVPVKLSNKIVLR